MKTRTQGFIFGLLAAFFYTIMAVTVKLAEHVPTEMLVFFRNIIPLLIILVPLFKKGVSIKTQHFKLHFIRSIFSLGSIYCYFITIKYIPVVDGIVLANTIPLFMPLVILIWMQLAIPLKRLIAVCIGFVGVLVILRPGVGIFHPMALFGVGAGVLGATALASVRKLTKTENTERILFYFFMISTVISFFPMLFSWDEPVGIDWVYILVLSLATTLYQVCLTRAYTFLPATKASSLMYFSVILAGLFSWIIWSQVPDGWTLVGSVLIIIGGLAAIFDKNEPRFISRKKS